MYDSSFTLDKSSSEFPASGSLTMALVDSPNATKIQSKCPRTRVDLRNLESAFGLHAGTLQGSLDQLTPAIPGELALGAFRHRVVVDRAAGGPRLVNRTCMNPFQVDAIKKVL